MHNMSSRIRTRHLTAEGRGAPELNANSNCRLQRKIEIPSDCRNMHGRTIIRRDGPRANLIGWWDPKSGNLLARSLLYLTVIPEYYG